MKRSFGQTSQPPSGALQPTIQPPPPPPGAPQNYFQQNPAPPLPAGLPPPPPTAGTSAPNPYAAYGYAAGYGMPAQPAQPVAGQQGQAAAHPQYPGYGYGTPAVNVTTQAQYNAYAAAYSQPQQVPGTPTYAQQSTQATGQNPYAAYQQQTYAAPQQHAPAYPQPNPYAQQLPQQPQPMTPQPQYPTGPPPIQRPPQPPQQQFNQFPAPSPPGPPPPKRTRYEQQPAVPAVGGGAGFGGIRGGRGGGRGGGMSGRGGYNNGGGFGGDGHSFNPATGPTNFTGPMNAQQQPYALHSPSGSSRAGSTSSILSSNRPSNLPPTPQFPRGGVGTGPPLNAPYGPSSSRGGGRGGGRGGRPMSGLPNGPRAGGGSHGGGRRDFADVPNAPKGPRAGAGARSYRRDDRDSNNKAIGKERKWGEKAPSKDVPVKEEEKKRTLTDFRISGLEIKEIEWEWRAKTDMEEDVKEEAKDDQIEPGSKVELDSTDAELVVVKTEVDTTATDHQQPPSSPEKADMSVDTIAPGDLPSSSVDVEESPKKKLSKKQKKLEAAAKRAATLAKAKEVVAVDEVAAEEKKKDGKHKRDEDEDDEKTDLIKKVKADTGDVIVLENVTPIVEPDADEKIPTGPAAESKDRALTPAPPVNRENSRLRIYFLSPVRSVSTYQVPPKAPLPREASVVSTARSVADTEPIKEEDVEENLDGAEVDVDGEPVTEDLEIVGTTAQAAGAVANGEESEDGDADGDAEAVQSALLSTSTPTPVNDVEEAVPSTPKPVTETATSTLDAEIVVVDNAAYPPNPYSQPESTIELAVQDTLPPEPSADRISISYARNTRRMVLDSEVVESVKILRAEGKIEMTVKVQPATLGKDATVMDEFRICKGVLVETLDPEADNFIVIDRAALELAYRSAPEPGADFVDTLLPPLHLLLADTTAAALQGEGVTVTSSSFNKDRITVVATLDRTNPLTEARWVKTGEVDAWISTLGGEAKKDSVSDWMGKISVADPDPPPTILHALETWATSSVVGSLADRQAFVAGHMSDIDNVFEILLRLTRGDRAGPSQFTASTQPSSVGALAASLHAPYAEHQTQVSLAVLAMFRLSMETAVKAGIPREEMEKQIGEIIRTIPWHLLFKSLDGIFREFQKTESGSVRKD